MLVKHVVLEPPKHPRGRNARKTRSLDVARRESTAKRSRSRSATTTIEEFNPVITANAPLIQCIPVVVTLDAGQGVSYLWSEGNTTRTISPSNTRYHSVTVINTTGCVVTSDSVYVRAVWPRTLGPRYCNRFNYWLTDIISTAKGIDTQNYNWEFVNLTTGDTTYHTSPNRAFVLSDVNPALQPGTNYGVRVRLLFAGLDTACFGNTCQIGITNFQGEGLNTYKLKSEFAFLKKKFVSF